MKIIYLITFIIFSIHIQAFDASSSLSNMTSDLVKSMSHTSTSIYQGIRENIIDRFSKNRKSFNMFQDAQEEVDEDILDYKNEHGIKSDQEHLYGNQKANKRSANLNKVMEIIREDNQHVSLSDRQIYILIATTYL